MNFCASVTTVHSALVATFLSLYLRRGGCGVNWTTRAMGQWAYQTLAIAKLSFEMCISNSTCPHYFFNYSQG